MSKMMGKCGALRYNITHLVSLTDLLRQLLDLGGTILLSGCGNIMPWIKPVWDVKGPMWPPPWGPIPLLTWPMSAYYQRM
jgi:hypothetical protein